MVSSASVTGSKDRFDKNQVAYFERIAAIDLKNPQIVGFGISNKTTFEQATQHQKGAIIGSSYIQHLAKNGATATESFIQTIL
jgi:tryptophan synthase alpha chain